MPGAERYDYLYSNSAVIPAGIGTRARIEIKTQQDSYFILQTAQAVSTGNFSAQISDDGSGLLWTNDFVQQANIFGTAQRPNSFIYPALVPPTSRILVDVQNLIAGPNTIEIAFGGYKVFTSNIPKDPNKPRADQWFQYVGKLSLLASNLDNIGIKLQADSHFEVHKMVAISTGNFELRWTDSGTGKSWSDRFIQRDNQFGTVQYPKILPIPKLLRPNITVQAEVRDLSGFNNDIEIVLEGVKKYTL